MLGDGFVGLRERITRLFPLKSSSVDDLRSLPTHGFPYPVAKDGRVIKMLSRGSQQSLLSNVSVMLRKSALSQPCIIVASAK